MKNKQNIEVAFVDNVIAVKTGNKVKKSTGYDGNYELVDEVYFYGLNGNHFFKNSNEKIAVKEVEFFNDNGLIASLGPGCPYLDRDGNIVPNHFFKYGIYTRANPQPNNKIKAFYEDEVIIVFTGNQVKRPIGYKEKVELIPEVYFFNKSGYPLYCNVQASLADKIISDTLLSENIELVVGPASPYINHEGKLVHFKNDLYVGIYIKTKLNELKK